MIQPRRSARIHSLAAAAVLAFGLHGCSSSTPEPGTGGRLGSGGLAKTGGATGTAGAGSGGTGLGGTAGTGGRGGAGGMLGSGGNSVGAGGAAGGQGQTGGAGGSGDGGRSGRPDGGAGSGGAAGGLDAAVGGQSGSGGITPTGGAAGSGGATGAGGIHDAATDGDDGGSTGTGPCDLYQAATPCVAAHSTVRALYGAYGGNLYQVRRASDKTTKDIGVLTAGGYANSATQESFCLGTTCTISVIYDQSPNGNHLTKAPAGGWLNNGGLEADASKAKITINGHTVYGVYTTSNFDNDVGAVGYRNNKTKAVPTGDQPESMYMVASGKHYNQWCCFDYGNAETNNKDNGPATMETVYFGNSTQWGRGSGSGPWVMADLEDGVFAGGSTAAPASNTPLVADYVTVMLKGPSGNRFALKGGDARSGTLVTKYDGARPSGYSPQKKEGAIILGIGGDNSHTGEGTFFEGCMTAGNPADAVDDAVQANIVAAGYGR
jgi:non-reducing end alpha-L-arabinofuranosidase